MMAPYLDADIEAYPQPGDFKPHASRILMIGWIEFAHEEWNEINSSYDVQTYSQGSREDFLQRCHHGDFDGVYAIMRSNQSAHLTGKYDKPFIDSLPASVQYVSNVGGGVDSIDLAYCHEKNIQVSNTPSVGRDAVADTALFLMLGCLRRATAVLARVRSGKWQENTPVGFSPQGMTLGLLGMGAIASAVAERAIAFGMDVQYYSRRPKHVKLLNKHAKRVSKEELLRTSNVISVHLPLNDSTRHIVSYQEFEMMQDHAILLNTARGAHVDQEALRQALDSGKVWAAGLDVFEKEPDVPEWMRHDERVMITPHVATRTRETRGDMEKLCMQNVSAVMAGKPLITPMKLCGGH